MGKLLDVEYRVDKKTGCWNWAGHVMKNGYGQRRDRATGKATTAHRHMYERAIGKIEPGLSLDHLCKNKACVNPKHLEPVTQGENVRRAVHVRLTWEKADGIRAMVKSGATQSDAGRKFGISQGVVSRIVRGLAWQR